MRVHYRISRRTRGLVSYHEGAKVKALFLVTALAVPIQISNKSTILPRVIDPVHVWVNDSWDTVAYISYVESKFCYVYRGEWACVTIPFDAPIMEVVKPNLEKP